MSAKRSGDRAACLGLCLQLWEAGKSKPGVRGTGAAACALNEVVVSLHPGLLRHAHCAGSALHTVWRPLR